MLFQISSFLLLCHLATLNSLTQSPTEILEQAISLYNNQHKREAIATAQLAVAADTSYYHAINFLGVVSHDLGDTDQARDYYQAAIAISPDYHGTWTNLGLLQRQTGFYQESFQAFEKALSLSPNDPSANNGMGLALHYLKRSTESIQYYNLALQHKPQFAEAMYNKGVSEMHIGEPQLAAKSYFLALEMDTNYVEAMINLASIHHRFGNIDMARTYYAMSLKCDRASIEDKIMSHTNMGVAYLMDYDGDQAIFHFLNARRLLEHQLSVVINQNQNQNQQEQEQSNTESATTTTATATKHKNKDGAWKNGDPTIDALVNQLVENLAHFSKTRTALCDWNLYEERLHELVHACDEQLDKGHQSALLPFDTLLLPVNPAWTLKVALKHSSQWEDEDRYTFLHGGSVATDANDAAETAASSSSSSSSSRLKIGYISHDFNDHPTAHMIEGLFVHHRSNKYNTYAYSYGKNDNSVFRKRISTEVEHFIDIATYNYEKSASVIYQDQIDILYDLQCHTRGNRVEIVAVKPSPIVVNFLIYPGAMGAKWIDYLISDTIVTPVELAKAHYKAKLCLFPTTYQVNYYSKIDYIDYKEGQQRTDTGVRASVDLRFENEQELDTGKYFGRKKNKNRLHTHTHVVTKKKRKEKIPF